MNEPHERDSSYSSGHDEPQPIECRAAVAVELSGHATNKNEIFYFPMGLQEITPVAGGIGKPIKVFIEPGAAIAMEERRRALVAKGKRPFFDLNHDDSAASFRPTQFIWRDGEGVIAKGEWTGSGKKAVEGKDYSEFSPVFYVDNKRAEAARVIPALNRLSPNMGGLVNDAAFNNLALWSKNDESLVNAGATGDNADKEKQMENEELAALRAKQQELEEKVDALKASNQPTNQSEVELENVRLKIEAAELRSRSALLSDQIQAKNAIEADSLIKSAIERGAILAKDYATQKTWKTQLIGDMATFGPLIKALPGNPMKERIIGAGGRVTITDDDPTIIYSAMASVLAKSRRCRKLSDKSEHAREFAAIYAREIHGSNKERMLLYPISRLEEAIQAADVTDGDLGTLSGTLVTQRTLELLKFTFPSLTMFTTDFSDQPAQFNQTIMTRTVDIPDVVEYNTSTGWSDSTASTQDIPVTMDQHWGVQITFNENILASTVRRLFDEQAPAQAYALAKKMVDDLYVNITDANFPNNRVVATNAFTRASVVDVGTDLDLLGVPAAMGNRTMLLWPTVFGKLVQDTALVTFAAFQKPELVTSPAGGGISLVIPVSDFQVVKAPNLPTNDGNITGFAGSKSALCIVTRVPNDYTSALPGASYGNVQMVTDPDLGMTVMLAQYVNHQLGTATSRIALMYGTAPGQSDAGELIKAAVGSGSSRTS